MLIYTIQHIFKNVCISRIEVRTVNRGVHIRLYTFACEFAMPKRCVDWEVVFLWMSSSLKLCWMSLCLCKLALLKIRWNSIPSRKRDGCMKTETPGSTHLHEPLQKKIAKMLKFSDVNWVKRTIGNKERTNAKLLKCRLVLDMIWGRKTFEQGLHLPTELHRCVQAPKLENQWLVLMIVEVGAPVSNLPNARRV